MRLLSAVPKTVLSRVPGRPPLILGKEEKVWPAPVIAIEPYTPRDVPDLHGEVVLHNVGRFGVIAVGADESESQATLRAKRQRLTYLRAYLDAFRTHNALLRAQGAMLELPRPCHHEALEELKRLRIEIADQDELLQGLEHVPLPQSRKAGDVRADELKEFGIVGEGLVPGVPNALMGLEEAL